MAEWHITSLVQAELRLEVQKRKLDILQRYARNLATMVENNKTADEHLKREAGELQTVIREIENRATNLNT